MSSTRSVTEPGGELGGEPKRDGCRTELINGPVQIPAETPACDRHRNNQQADDKPPAIVGVLYVWLLAWGSRRPDHSHKRISTELMQSQITNSRAVSPTSDFALDRHVPRGLVANPMASGSDDAASDPDRWEVDPESDQAAHDARRQLPPRDRARHSCQLGTRTAPRSNPSPNSEGRSADQH